VRRLRLIFIDDDEDELDKFKEIVKGHYDCDTFQWPRESEKLFKSKPPDVFVSDLYLPPCSGDTTPTPAEIRDAKRGAGEVAKLFESLFSNKSRKDKDRLRDTMDAIRDAYSLLKKQWSALGQSPGYGVALLTKLKDRYPEVPFVFYSRKITPEDVICVLRAGAFDAIRKGALSDEEVVARIASAYEVYRRANIRNIRASGFNANITTERIEGSKAGAKSP
jgi:DNA-binding NtrC family response regulator